MILTLKSGVTKKEVDKVIAKIKELGFTPSLSRGTERVVIGVIGDKAILHKDKFETMEEVEVITPISKPYKLVSREFNKVNTVVSIGKVKVGQRARVYLDSAPYQPLEAYVTRVDPESTFTPENTYFRNERVKQVVGVKLQLKEGFGFAKPGMPADGEILVQGDKWPAFKWKR